MIPPLRVERLDGERYRVSGGAGAHCITRDTETREWMCDCAGFHYRGRCTHIAAVLMFCERYVAPCPPAVAAIIDPMTEDEVLDVLGPSWAEKRGKAHQVRAALGGGDGLHETIEAETFAVLDRCAAKLLALETTVAEASGNRMRVWWLKARAAALGARRNGAVTKP